MSRLAVQDFLYTGFQQFFTVPSGVYMLYIWGIGGGGGGGSGAGGSTNSTTRQCGGGGGGGGAFGRGSWLPVVPGEVLTIDVGAGGAGGPEAPAGGNGSNGSNGGTTSVYANSAPTGVLCQFGGAGGGRAGGANNATGNGGDCGTSSAGKTGQERDSIFNDCAPRFGGLGTLTTNIYAPYDGCHSPVCCSRQTFNRGRVGTQGLSSGSYKGGGAGGGGGWADACGDLGGTVFYAAAPGNGGNGGNAASSGSPSNAHTAGGAASGLGHGGGGGGGGGHAPSAGSSGKAGGAGAPGGLRVAWVE